MDDEGGEQEEDDEEAMNVKANLKALRDAEESEPDLDDWIDDDAGMRMDEVTYAGGIGESDLKRRDGKRGEMSYSAGGGSSYREFLFVSCAFWRSWG